MKNLLSVKIHESLFCFELSWVLRVVLLASLKEIPEAPPYYLGLLNLQGEAVPVLDLGERIGVAREAPYSLQTAIIIIQDGKNKYGLVVDRVEGTVQCSETALGEKPAIDMAEPLYKASVNVNNQIGLLLDMEYLVRHI